MKLKFSLLLISCFLIQSCGSTKTSNFNGVSYDIYDTRSFVELDDQSPVDYGCVSLKNRRGASLVGEEQISLRGPDVVLRWTIDEAEANISFELYSVGGGESSRITKPMKYFREGNVTNIFLRIEDDREISVELMGKDC